MPVCVFFLTTVVMGPRSARAGGALGGDDGRYCAATEASDA